MLIHVTVSVCVCLHEGVCLRALVRVIVCVNMHRNTVYLPANKHVVLVHLHITVWALITFGAKAGYMCVCVFVFLTHVFL